MRSWRQQVNRTGTSGLLEIRATRRAVALSDTNCQSEFADTTGTKAVTEHSFKTSYWRLCANAGIGQAFAVIIVASAGTVRDDERRMVNLRALECGA